MNKRQLATLGVIVILSALYVFWASKAFAQKGIVYADSQWSAGYYGNEVWDYLRSVGIEGQCYCVGGMQMMQMNLLHWPRAVKGEHDFIYIALGTNDANGQAQLPADWVGINSSWWEVYIHKMEKLVKNGQQSGAHVFIELPTLPTWTDRDVSAFQVYRFLTWLTFSGREGVTLVDLEGKVEVGGDNLHHSAAGKRTHGMIAAEAIHSAL